MPWSCRPVLHWPKGTTAPAKPRSSYSYTTARRVTLRLTGFLREHYTTQTRTAALLANYLTNAPAAIQAAATEAKKGNERDAKGAGETLDSKLRGYATAGQEARPPAE